MIVLSMYKETCFIHKSVINSEYYYLFVHLFSFALIKKKTFIEIKIFTRVNAH